MRYKHRDSDEEEEDFIITEKDPTTATSSLPSSTRSTVATALNHENNNTNEGNNDSNVLQNESSYLSPIFNSTEIEKNCLMKSTFFELIDENFEDQLSDICGSEGEILELSNYVSTSSPERKESNNSKSRTLVNNLNIFEDSDDVELTVFPEIVEIDDANITSSYSVIKNICCTIKDIVAFKGKSFRIGWTKQLTFLTLEKNEFSNLELVNQRISFKRLTNLNHNIMDKLEKHLECQFNNSSMEYKNGIPYSFSIFGNNKLFEHQNIEKSLSESHEKQIWDLLAVLFKIEKNIFTKEQIDGMRKKELSKWIESVVGNSVEIEANNKSDFSKILSYLSGNKINKAVELALESRNFNLALLISQLPTSFAAAISFKKQLVVWEQCNVHEFIDENLIKIYALLSRNLQLKTGTKTIFVYEGMDWFRIFALCFWFIIKSERPLSEAVNLYEKMFKEYKTALQPTPDYEETFKNVFDLKFHILKYYSDNSYSVAQLFNPFSYTNDPLDYRLSWFLFQTLDSLNQNISNNRIKNYLHINFARQLEQIGFWHWAIYILTYIDNNLLKHEIIMDILGRNVQLSNEETSEYIIMEKMLVEKFQICPEWIENQKAIKAEYSQKYIDAAFYFLYSKNWSKYYDLLMISMIPKHLMSHNYEYIIELLSPLAEKRDLLPNWEDNGGFLLDFARLYIHYKDIIVLDNPILIKNCLLEFKLSLIDIRDRVKNFEPKNYMQDVCLVEISKIVAVMLRKLLTIIDNPVFEILTDTAINAQHVSVASDYLKQELYTILSDFLNKNQK